MLSVNKTHFNSSFPNCLPAFPFSLLRHFTDQSPEPSGQCWLEAVSEDFKGFPLLGRKQAVSWLSMMLAVLFIDVFYLIEVSFCSLLNSFYHECVLNFVKWFICICGCCYDFSLYLVNAMNLTNWFSNIKPTWIPIVNFSR